MMPLATFSHFISLGLGVGQCKRNIKAGSHVTKLNPIFSPMKIGLHSNQCGVDT